MKIKHSESSKKIIHLNLLGNKEEQEKNLIYLRDNLEGQINETNIEHWLTLTNEEEYVTKFAELMGHKIPYSILASEMTGEESFLISNEIVSRLNLPEIYILSDDKKTKVVKFSDRDLIMYNQRGEIIDSSNKDLIGKNSLDYISCNIHEEIATVMLRGHKLIYAFESSMFEKTPKNIITGKNNYIGRDFMKFHGKAKTFGHVLPAVFKEMIKAFSKYELDMLTIDLRGNNIYSNNNLRVRRFERDYILPIRDIRNNAFKGLLGYADVFFQNIEETKSPFEGGSHIKISSPLEFIRKYRVK